MEERSARELVDILKPDHDRTSCSDKNRNNSFGSRGGKWHGRCTRCMWLDLADGQAVPKDFDPEECFG
ncbi:MAG: hypothetical protein EOP14_00270 [Pseudomonas sp.]|nr:MAG: hypothetical protein EOP14_00270 [Pseudomonas sp.]